MNKTTERINRLFKEQQHGLSRTAIANRITRGWTDERILKTPKIRATKVDPAHPMKDASYIRMVARKIYKERQKHGKN